MSSRGRQLIRLRRAVSSLVPKGEMLDIFHRLLFIAMAVELFKILSITSLPDQYHPEVLFYLVVSLGIPSDHFPKMVGSLLDQLLEVAERRKHP